MEIKIQLTDLQFKAIADQHIDVTEHCQGVINNGANSLMAKKIKQEFARLREDPAVETMPASDDGILDAYFAADGYLDAKGREDARIAEQERIAEEAETTS